jgi:hypothetical protein
VTASPRCAVLFGLPTNRMEFDAVAAGRAVPDYGRGLMRGQSAESVWAERYVRVVDTIRDLCETVAAVDGRTYPEATLSDVTSASAWCDTLILVAHWRGWLVAHSDFREPAAAVEHRLRAAGLGDLLARRNMSMSEIVAGLNDVIARGTLQRRLVPEADAYAPGVLLAATLGRDALDELFGEAIDPGNRVELYDGLHQPGALEGAIVPGFRGTIDLATCASQPLATIIKIRRGTRVQVVHTVDAVDPLPCCRLIGAAMRLAGDTGVGYAAARTTVASALRDYASHEGRHP